MNTKLNTAGALLGAMGIWLLSSMGAAHGATITWSVAIMPAAGGQVAWSTTAPPASGTLARSGRITFSKGSYVDLTFNPKPSGSLISVYKNADNITTWLDGSRHYRFGPVDSPHLIRVLFGLPPDPTGSFPLAYPANETSLTAIADVTGNYSGVTPSSRHRAYNIDVAQDESGKLAVAGTVQGIEQKKGVGTLPQLSGNVGSVATLSQEPTAQLRGSFAGTRDGSVVTAAGSARGTVEIKDIGSGTNGLAGTASGSARVAGVPFRAPSAPVALPLSLANASNLHKSWTITPKFVSKVDARGRSYIMASATLLLPNGDTIVFPEKRKAYSAKRGYTVIFARGTNITINPPKIDRKTTVTITGMILTAQGATWTPTAGRIKYSFLGQKGSGNLLDFAH